MGSLASTVLQLLMTYGPEAVTGIETLVGQLENGKPLALADVEAAFAPLKPYSAYQIQNANTANGVNSTITG